MNMKPEFITNTDWEILKKMYPDNLKEIATLLNNNYPVQYLIGNVEFCDATIKVNEDVLIPRFETEYFVEKIIERLKKYPANSLKIVDIGTGSGCISIALKMQLNQIIEGLDISFKALKIAEENAKLNNVDIKWRELDILTNELPEKYDVIISNPPYVKESEIVDAKTKYEPQNAIFASDNGLLFYKRILEIIDYNPLLIAFEIGMTEGEEIAKIAKKKFLNATINIEKDLTGKDRYLFIVPNNK